MTAAIWSSSSQGILNFPIMYLLMFLNNHLLLQTSDNIKWMTPKNRSEVLTHSLLHLLIYLLTHTLTHSINQGICY